ncbi:chloride channel protein [Hyphobacterium sp.]|uniref:chloride channel protein n=1 Tax=Hyphobacterium sp. TaxID=2004662 RepID=UPI003BAB8F2F
MSDSPPSSRSSSSAWLIRQWRDGRSIALWPLGLIMGVIAGYAALGLILAIEVTSFLVFGADHEQLVTGIARLPAWHVMLAPVGGGIVVAALLYVGHKRGWLPEARAGGIADVMEARAARGGKITVANGLISTLISSISLGSGGSAGREGPAVHLGAALASLMARLLGLPPRGVKILLACGAAAAVAASFNAPVAGALFAFEIVLGHYALRSIAPVAIASVTGALISRAHLGVAPAFSMPALSPASLLDLPGVVVLGLLSALVAAAFIRSTVFVPRWVGQQADRMKFPLWALPPIGGVLIGMLALIAPEILGVGYEATATALAGGYTITILLLLVLLKLAATAITLGFRFGGGVFSPSLYLGAMLGAAFGGALALTGWETAGVPFYAVVGMGAVAGAALGAPLSTTLIVFELTASYEASVAVLIAVSLATVLSQSLAGGSVFHLQVLRRGYDLSRGQARVLLQTIRVRDIMSEMTPEEAGADTDKDAACLYEDDYLGRAIGFLSAEGIDGTVVRSRSGDQPIVGYISRTDAHAAYAKALADAHEEEHR